MNEFVSVTDEVLARARLDPVFRQKLLAENLDRLLAQLKKLRGTNAESDPACAQQIREGVQLAVVLAERIQTLANDREATASQT